MGIVNLTPDSFSGDGVVNDPKAAIAHAQAQIAAGADILDIGAESSRPGAIPTSLQEELDRLLPVLEALCDCGVPISVDTYKPEVMRAALACGAAMINDISGFRNPAAIEAIRGSDCGLCVMHMRGEPLTMQAQPEYQDVVAEVDAFLQLQIAQLDAAGIARERLVLDPGFGFGKTLEHNLSLFRALPAWCREWPVLVGVSRKTMIGQITGQPVPERMAGSVAAALLAAQSGAHLLRVHDVAATRDALAVLAAVSGSQKQDTDQAL